jgi:hypothetical protein
VVAHELAPGSPHNRRPATGAEAALWTPAWVALGYVPDAAAAALSPFVPTDPLLASHSIPLGMLAGIAVGIAGFVVTRRSPALLISLGLMSIVGHDVLDLLQATDRAPFWPLTIQGPGASLAWIPDRISGELAVLGPPFLCWAAWRFSTGAARREARERTATATATVTWTARGLVLLLVLTPVAAYYTRRTAEREVLAAQRMLRDGRFEDALRAADSADRWAWIVRRGRTDLVRGEVYEALGDEGRAESHYRRAYELDRNNFWAVADLAEFHASHGDPATRRRRSMVFLAELRARFTNNPALEKVRADVETKLQRQ